MKISYLLSYLNSNKGRKMCQIGVTTVTTGLLVFRFMPVTFGLDIIKGFMCAYRDGSPIKVTDEVMNCFSEAIKHAELESYQHEAIEPFISSGLEIFSMGSLQSFFGGIMAIPLNFIYEKDSIIKPQLKQVGKVNIDPSKKEAKDFYDSLVLSTDAKIFAITRELKYLQSLRFYEMFLEPAYLYGMYKFGAYLSNNYNFYDKHLSIRLCLYSMVTILGLTMYFFAKDSYQSLSEQEIDKELANKNEQLRKGGLEFYEKQLQRNLAMRKLLGSSGPKKFSNEGNEIYKFRHKHFPLVHRREFYQTKDIN